MENLDLCAARAAQIINEDTTAKAPKAEALVTKTLGVLQENGPYACLLFLLARPKEEQELAKALWGPLLALLQHLGLKSEANEPAQKILSRFTDQVCRDLDTLLLVRQVWEQALTYARYGAKAQQREPG